MELSLKEYANQLNISYEAVRQSFKLHEGKELIRDVHFRQSGRTKILTDAGINIMNEFRKQPVTVLPGDVAKLQTRIDELEELTSSLSSDKTVLEQENQSLKAEKETLQTRITDLTEKLSDMNMKLSDANGQVANLNDRLSEALFRIQESSQRVLPEPEQQKRGFFSRIFSRKAQDIEE